MKNILATFIGLASLFAVGAPSVHAYSGVVSDVWYGEHPYEQRKIEENRRKRLAREFEEHGYYTFDNPAYYHPIYAQRSVLHPFYRKGGTTQYIDGRFARWRGHQDPVIKKNLSPDTHCTNYTFQRYGYRSQPSGYQCF